MEAAHEPDQIERANACLAEWGITAEQACAELERRQRADRSDRIDPDTESQRRILVDVRGKVFEQADPVRDLGLSQSEIVATLRGQMHTGRPYSLEQLIHDIENLTPERLDLSRSARPTSPAPGGPSSTP